MEYKIRGSAVVFNPLGTIGGEVIANRESLVIAIGNLERQDLVTDEARDKLLDAYEGALVYLDAHIDDEFNAALNRLAGGE